MAATNYSYFDVGGCNCLPPAVCQPCNLPFSTLHLSATYSGGTAGVSAGPWTNPIGASYLWTFAGCVAIPGAPFYKYFKAVLACNGVVVNTTQLTISMYTTSACSSAAGTLIWAVGGGSSFLSLSSYTCSPLSMLFQGSGPFALYQWTLTL